MPSADPPPRLVDGFDSVAAVSRHQAWAVGDYDTGQETGPQGAFIERWNGRRWRLAAKAIPHDADPESVSASGARDAWVVGQRGNGAQLIEHSNGSRWHRAPVPQVRRSDLFAVAARAPRDAWAVGVRGNGVVRTLIEHWNGSRWTIVPSPNVRAPNGVTDDWLFSISAGRSDDVWAVGSWGSQPRSYGGTGDHALALHWDGHRWSHVATPPIARGSLLFGVAARGNQAWAVGSRGAQADAETLIEHWDGAHWTTVPGPPGLWFKAVATSPAGPVWAVGQNGRQPLAAQC